MFDNFFEIFLADTKEGRAIHYNIRYQVYCEELEYEDSEQFPDKKEFDKWDPANDQDQRSRLFLVRLKHTKEWVGAMRLVHSSSQKLPLQEVSSLNHNVDNSSIEVSRLCLVKRLRKPYIQYPYGINETSASNYQLATKEKVADENQEKYFQHNSKVKNTIISGLFNAVSNYCKSNNIKSCYLLSSKGLMRIVKRQGFSIKQVGSSCKHRGSMRSPYLIDVDRVKVNPLGKAFNKSYRLFSELGQQKVAFSALA